MKKYLAILCAALLLTACGGEKQGTADSAKSDPVNLDDYIGYYTDGNYDDVTIEKNRDGYSMTVGLYRLTTLDEGTVSASSDGVIFHTIDAAGNPMTMSFYIDGKDKYALRIEESTWEYLEPGTVYDNMVKITDRESYPDP